MFGLRTIALVAVVAALIFSGVLDVSVHVDKIPQAPKAILSLLKTRGVFEQGRVYGVRAKRYGELFFAGTESAKMELVLKYIDLDSERLNELIADAETPKALVPQAELLVGSLEKAKEESKNASPETLAEFKDQSIKAHQSVAAAFKNLQRISEEYESYQKQLAEVAGLLKQKLESLPDSGEEAEGGVAGAEDKAEEDVQEESNPASSIPLQF